MELLRSPVAASASYWWNALYQQAEALTLQWRRSSASWLRGPFERRHPPPLRLAGVSCDLSFKARREPAISAAFRC